jgi:ATP-dependent Clp protease ATP-binding subunit ClpC
VIDRFSPRCRRALVAAEREARSLKHGHIATEHLLLGLLRVEDCVAARALRLTGVTYPKARRRITRLVDAGSERPKGPLPFTPRVREIIEDAFTGSVWTLRLGQSLVGAPFAPSPKTPWGTPVLTEAPRLSQGRVKVCTENLLLALIADGEGVAARVLADLGIDLETAAVATQNVRSPRLEAPMSPFEQPAGWPPSPPKQN